MFTRNSMEGFFEIRRNKKSFSMDDMSNSTSNRLLTAEHVLNACAVYDSPPHVCFKLAEVVEDMLRKSISRVNQGLTHIAPVPPVLVTYD